MAARERKGALLPPAPGAYKVPVACQSQARPALRSKNDLEGIWPRWGEEMKGTMGRSWGACEDWATLPGRPAGE